MKHQFNQLEDLFWAEIADLYDAEKRLVDALPKMAEAAHNSELKTAFKNHLSETKEQVKRLEQVFKLGNKSPERETCPAMKGLIQEGDDMIKAKGDPDVKDAALITAAQRVEHYEMAGYGSARTLARHLGYDEAAELLQTTLDEEGSADKKLTQVAEGLVNQRAAQA